MQPAISIVEYKGYKFLIMDAPQEHFEFNWATPLVQHGASTLVCTTERTYVDEIFTSRGISVIDLFFADGTEPSAEIQKAWLDLLFTGPNPPKCLGIHCLAGLGRACVLVALVLIELGMSSSDAILHIRNKRQGAISARQVSFLQTYVPRNKGKFGCCFRCCVVQ